MEEGAVSNAVYDRGNPNKSEAAEAGAAGNSKQPPEYFNLNNRFAQKRIV